MSRARLNPRPAVLEPPSNFPRGVKRILAHADRTTCPTGKVGYQTHRKALRALEAFRDRGGTERAVYTCRECGAHHLTSQDPHARSAA